LDTISALCIFFGGGLGALARWSLGLALNPLFPQMPPGTLAANVLGGVLMGCALGAFTQFEALPPAARLAITTGFLGGMTTFSTFSAESAQMLLRGEYRWAGLHAGLHVLASLAATLAALHATNAAFRTFGGAQ
jgi:fluoride exporter